MCRIEVKLNALQGDDTQPEASPHYQEGKELPRGVNYPLAEYGHERRTQRVQDDHDDGHDDAVAQDQDAWVGEAAAAHATVVVVVLLRAHERVRIVSHGGCRQVERPRIMRVVALDLGVRVRAVDGIACLPCRNPGRRVIV